MTRLLAAERGHTETTTATARMRSRDEREALAMRAFAARALRAVRSSPCTVHGARSGQACWPMPGERFNACGRRVAAVFG